MALYFLCILIYTYLSPRCSVEKAGIELRIILKRKVKIVKNIKIKNQYKYIEYHYFATHTIVYYYYMKPFNLSSPNNPEKESFLPENKQDTKVRKNKPPIL